MHLKTANNFSMQYMIFCIALLLPLHSQSYISQKEGRSHIDLNAFLKEGLKNKQNVLVLPPGTHYFGVTASVLHLTNVTITGSLEEGKETILVGNFFKNGFEHIPAAHAFKFFGCNNVTLENVTIDYDPLPFTQGTIADILPGNIIIVSLHAGYQDLPADLAAFKEKAIFFYEKETRVFKEEIVKGYWNLLEKTSVRSYKIRVPHERFNKLQTGDYIVLLVRPSGVIRNDYCRDMTFQNINMLGGPGLGYGTYSSTGKFKYNKLRIDRGPKPNGATEDRLMSTTADGMQHRICETGPTMTDCWFGHMGDDGFNNSALMWPIAKVLDSRSVVIVARGGIRVERFHAKILNKNSTAKLIQHGSFQLIQEPKVESIVDYPEMTEEPPVVKSNWGQRGDRFHKVAFSQNIDKTIIAGDGIYFPFANSKDYSISNCTFYNIGANALRISSEDGVIQNNTIDRCFLSGIAMPINMDFWMESGPVKNVVIRNNVIKNTGLDHMANEWYMGAIQMSAPSSAYREGVPKNLMHSDVIISNNIIKNSYLNGIFISHSENVIVTANTIKNVNKRKGSKVFQGICADHPIAAQYSKKIVVGKNTFDNGSTDKEGNVVVLPWGEAYVPQNLYAKTPLKLLSEESDALNWETAVPTKLFAKAGENGFSWEQSRNGTSLKTKTLVTNDWTSFNYISLWLHSQNNNGAEIAVTLTSPHSAELGNYYLAKFAVTSAGWQEVTIPFSSFEAIRTPKGWNNITAVGFNLFGFGGIAKKQDTILFVDEVTLGYDPEIK